MNTPPKINPQKVEFDKIKQDLLLRENINKIKA